MKKALVFILMVVAATGFAHAQKGTTSPEAKAKKMLSKMHAAAKLQGDQTSKVNKVLTDYYTQKQQIENTTTLSDKKGGKDKLDALKKNRDKQLKAILTADQWKKWMAYKEVEKEAKKENKDEKD